MNQFKTFILENRIISSPTHSKFEQIFDYSHHTVTGKWHNGKRGVDFLEQYSSGDLQKMVLSNPHVSGTFEPGLSIFGIRDKTCAIWVGVEKENQTTYYNANYNKKLQYEDCVDIINTEIQKRRNKWQLTAIQWFDYEDVSQILRLHIYKKFDMWDQNRSLAPWLNVIISHQISNLLRNNYGNYSRPCLKCDANEGGDLCSLYTTQCDKCPLYKKWLKTKKNAYDSKLPLPLEHHTQEVYDMPDNDFDLERSLKNLDERMKVILKPIEYKIFHYLYIKGGKEDGVGKLLGFKHTEKGYQSGYKQLKTLKENIIKKVKAAIYNDEIDL